jgi:hypothetical protein
MAAKLVVDTMDRDALEVNSTVSLHVPRAAGRIPHVQIPSVHIFSGMIVELMKLANLPSALDQTVYSRRYFKSKALLHDASAPRAADDKQTSPESPGHEYTQLVDSLLQKHGRLSDDEEEDEEDEDMLWVKA